jgi:hypothetical protein
VLRAPIIAAGQWVDENARMRARLHDVHAAAATPAAKPGSLAGGAGASMRAGGANAQQREIAALTAALRSARDAERIARKAATDAAGHAAVQFGTLEQSLSDKTAALRRCARVRPVRTSVQTAPRSPRGAPAAACARPRLARARLTLCARRVR